MKLHKFLTAPVLIAILLLTACTPSTLVSSLQIAVDAVTVAIPVLAAAGVDSATLMQVQTYLTAVSTATEEAATELATSDTSAVKVSKIVADFAGVVAPVIGNPRVSAVVQAVAAAVQSFLTLLQQQQPSGPAAKAIASTVVKPSFADRSKLGAIKSQCEKNLAALKH